jgi:hypothetical protein
MVVAGRSDENDLGVEIEEAKARMKNPTEVLWMKEQELSKVREQVEALRITARLLSDEGPAGSDIKQDLRQRVEMP